MGENLSEFGSDRWIPKLKELCFNVQKNLQKRPGGQFLYYRENLIGTIEKPGVIIEEYHASVNSLKLELFGGNAINSHLDYHKISALLYTFISYT